MHGLLLASKVREWYPVKSIYGPQIDPQAVTQTILARVTRIERGEEDPPTLPVLQPRGVNPTLDLSASQDRKKVLEDWLVAKVAHLSAVPIIRRVPSNALSSSTRNYIARLNEATWAEMRKLAAQEGAEYGDNE